MTNNAVPSRVGTLRSRGFYVDNTPPTEGTATLSLSLPPGYTSQSGFPEQLEGLTVVVKLSGFGDSESGVEQLEVNVTANGTLLFTSVFASGEAPIYRTPPLPPLLNGTQLQAVVAATNGAGLASAPVASPIRHLILESIQLDEPWVAAASGGPLANRFIAETDALSIGFVAASDPMNRAGAPTSFTYTWGVFSPPCDDAAMAVARSLGVILPSGVGGRDMWPADLDRRTLGAKSFHDVALIHTQQYCVYAEACAVQTSAFPDVRCVNATSLDYVTVDVTPPAATVGDATPMNASSGPFPMYVDVECTDEESGSPWGELSLGTTAVPHMLVRSVLLNASDSGNATSDEEGAAQFFVTARNASGWAGRVEITEDALRAEANLAELEGARLVATLVCSNGLGRRAAAGSQTPLRYDTEPPVTGEMSFASQQWSEVDGAWLASPSAAASTTLSWGGFIDGASRVASYHLCAGLDAFDCSVADADLPADGLSATLQFVPTQPMTAAVLYYINLRARDVSGLSSSLHTKLLIDYTEPHIGNLTSNIDGVRTAMGACGYTHAFEFGLELMAGAWDDDTETPLAFEWDAANVAACSFEHNASQPDALSWTVRCGGTTPTTLNFALRANSAVGLSSPWAATCVVVDPSPPVWSSTPSLVFDRARDMLRLSWVGPVDPDTGACRIDFSVCTAAGCTVAEVAMSAERARNLTAGASTELLLPRSSLPGLRGFKGEVWAALNATNRVGLVASVTTAQITTALEAPSEGRVVLTSASRLSDASQLEGGLLRVEGLDEPVRGFFTMRLCLNTTALVRAGTTPDQGGHQDATCRDWSRGGATLDLRSMASTVLAAAVGVSESNTASYVARASATACYANGQCLSAFSDELLVDSDAPTRYTNSPSRPHHPRFPSFYL